jgi:hypothetical protein
LLLLPGVSPSVRCFAGRSCWQQQDSWRVSEWKEAACSTSC